jgi:hypothetical protein
VGPDGYTIGTAASATVKTSDQSWQAATSREIVDGETLVFGQVAANKAGARVVRLVFVSIRIIDPPGNSVHTDEELSGKY